MRRALAVLAVVVAAASAPTAAWAHATLLRSSPPDRGVVPTAPSNVRLFFDDVVTPGPGIGAVRNGGGSVLGGRARTVSGNGRILVIPLKRIGRGAYTVRWRVISDDGHLIGGVLAFAVGAGSAPPTPTLSGEVGGPGTRNVLGRWLLIAGVLGAGGSALVGAGLRRRLGRSLPVAADHAAKRASAAVIAVGSALALAGALVERVGEPAGTRFARATEVGAVVSALTVVLAVGAVLLPRLWAWSALPALGLLGIPTAAGHALDPGQSSFQAAADVLHVIGAAAWIGGLLALVVVVPVSARAAPAGERGRLASAAVRRISWLALGAVVLIAVTGAVRAVAEVGALRNLLDTGYGRAIDVKTGLLLVLVAIGYMNRTRLVPVAARAAALVRLRRAASAELTLLAGLVVAVAFLTALRPGRSVSAATPALPPATAPATAIPPPPRGAFVDAGGAGSFAVGLAQRTVAGKLRLQASVIAPSGDAASGRRVRFRAGGAAIAGRPCGPGCYTADVSPRSRSVRVEVAGRSVSLPLSDRRPDDRALRLLRRVERTYLAARSLVFRERLASSPERAVHSFWRVQAPDRLSYELRDGTAGIVIGGRRWDRSRHGPWQQSAQEPLRLPAAPWARRVRNVTLLGAREVGGRPVWILTLANLDVPAWYRLTVDRRTLHLLTEHMTAPAHFMEDRYLGYDRPVRIRPPLTR